MSIQQTVFQSSDRLLLSSACSCSSSSLSSGQQGQLMANTAELDFACTWWVGAGGADGTQMGVAAAHPSVQLLHPLQNAHSALRVPWPRSAERCFLLQWVRPWILSSVEEASSRPLLVSLQRRSPYRKVGVFSVWWPVIFPVIFLFSSIRFFPVFLCTPCGRCHQHVAAVVCVAFANVNGIVWILILL